MKSLCVQKTGAISSLSCFVITSACSAGNPIKPVCSSSQSLIRFDQPSVNLAASGMLAQYGSHGGFIEVLTRSETLGQIDSSRLCTAYVEFTDDPVNAPVPPDAEPLKINIFTASHCLDLSKDYRMKLHFFNGAAYQNVWLNYEPLHKVNALRKSMIKKRVPKESQILTLNSFRAAATDINELFRSTGSATTNTTNTLASQVCLERESPTHQNVCATFQDLSMFKVIVSDESLPALTSELIQLRKGALDRQKGWITKTNLKDYVDSYPSFTFSFTNEQGQMSLAQLHTEVRSRIHKLTLLKELKHVDQELLSQVRSCREGFQERICEVLPELTDFVRTQLNGTGLDDFRDEQMGDVLESLPSSLNAAFARMDRAFTAFAPFIAENQIKLTTRIHSNYRFVTGSEPTIDKPDPKDSVDTGRAFMQFNANNLTGDVNGGGVKFIKWSNTASSALLGRFLHLSLPREITDIVRANKGSSPVAHIGFMQAGDSGSVAVIEQIPFFAFTSVDGEPTSGGAGIRPLPEPIEDPEFEDAPLSNVASCTNK
jgi:hypothetical protein